MRKTAAAAAMAASLAIGGGTGAVLFAPNLVGAQSDGTQPTETESDRPARGQFLADALAPLVDDGTIDQGQADAVVTAIEDARPDGFGERRHGRHHGRHVASEAVTDLLGIDADELRQLLADGQTLAEIGEANGVSVEELVAALVTELEERLDSAVDDGDLTQEEADEKLAGATERVTAIVNGERPERDGPRGHGGPGTDAPTHDTADDADETTGS